MVFDPIWGFGLYPKLDGDGRPKCYHKTSNVLTVDAFNELSQSDRMMYLEKVAAFIKSDVPNSKRVASDFVHSGILHDEWQDSCKSDKEGEVIVQEHAYFLGCVVGMTEAQIGNSLLFNKQKYFFTDKNGFTDNIYFYLGEEFEVLSKTDQIKHIAKINQVIGTGMLFDEDVVEIVRRFVTSNVMEGYWHLCVNKYADGSYFSHSYFLAMVIGASDDLYFRSYDMSGDQLRKAIESITPGDVANRTKIEMVFQAVFKMAGIDTASIFDTFKKLVTPELAAQLVAANPDLTLLTAHAVVEIPECWPGTDDPSALVQRANATTTEGNLPIMNNESNAVKIKLPLLPPEVTKLMKDHPPVDVGRGMTTAQVSMPCDETGKPYTSVNDEVNVNWSPERVIDKVCMGLDISNPQVFVIPSELTPDEKSAVRDGLMKVGAHETWFYDLTASRTAIAYMKLPGMAAPRVDDDGDIIPDDTADDTSFSLPA